MNAELLDFTRQSLQSGIPRADIAAALAEAGWPRSQIDAVLSAFADSRFPIPVPRPKPYLSAREMFVYLLMFAALYSSIYNLGSILFTFIDRAFPDGLRTYGLTRDLGEAIRWNLSSLVVLFPLFLFTFLGINKSLAQDPTKRESRPRKWLTYMTLFFAAVAIAGDLIGLIYNALGGELTVRFLLKVAVVGVTSGGTFAYFFTDIRKDDRK